MIHYCFPKRYFAALLALGLFAALQFPTQVFGGAGGLGGLFGGAFTGGAGATGRGGGRGSSTSYAPPGTVGDATFSIDPENRSIVAIADDKTLAYIAQVITNLDTPKPQVLIKVVFVEVTRNNSSDLGIEGDWGKAIGQGASAALTHSFGMGLVGMATNTTGGAIQAIQQNNVGQPVSSLAAPGAGLYSVLGADYNVTMRAIAQSGQAKVLSRPSIVVRNNQPATITVGQSVPLITSVRFDNYGNAINSVTYTSVGIILQVTPFITRDGMVEMIVSPQISDLVADRSQWVPISSGSAGNAAAPLIDTRSADTVVCVPDNQTVIIGGLMQDSKADSETKIPLLGDIPIVGNLFKRVAKNKTQTELLIFLTPTIMQAPAELAALRRHEEGSSGAARGLTESERHTYLDTLPQKAPATDTTTPPPGNSK